MIIIILNFVIGFFLGVIFGMNETKRQINNGDIVLTTPDHDK